MRRSRMCRRSSSATSSCARSCSSGANTCVASSFTDERGGERSLEDEDGGLPIPENVTPPRHGKRRVMVATTSEALSSTALDDERPPPGATLAVRGDPADELAPPVQPNLVRPAAVPGARNVGRNTIEILLFRGLSTPLALALVVLQSRFLEPSGRGAYVVAVLGVTIFSRLLGQLGVAVTNRLPEEPRSLGPLTRRAFALGAAAGAVAVPLIAL